MNPHRGTMSVSAGISEETQLSPDAIQGRYTELGGVREELLRRARDMASLTIPSILPYEGQNESQELPTPYQAVGARAVNNLSNKLLLTLFPVSSPFFKLEVAEALVQKMQQQDADIKEDIEAKMSEMENIIQSDMEVNAFRTKFFEALRSLVVVGNFLLYIPAKGEPSGYRFDQYVVKRSVQGKVLELILEEIISAEEIPQEWEDQLKAADKWGAQGDKDAEHRSIKDRKYKMYTRVHLEDGMYKEAKYINGEKLSGSEAKYPENASAWLPLRWNGLSGEDYGRSYVEEYLADLIALEGLAQSILENSAIASKTFGILRPNSNMSPLDLVRVQNGGFVTGDPEDLVFPEVGKQGDMTTANNMYNALVESLSRAFLLTQVRDSERTTAEEIRLMASELETALGGAYSLLAVTFQQPILMREMSRLKKSKDLPTINEQDFKPKIIVGLEGLGRGTDLDKLLKAAAALANLQPVLQTIPDVDQQKTVQFVFNAVGLDSDEILKSAEKKAAEAAAQQQQLQQQQTADIVQAAAGPVAGQLAKGAVENPAAAESIQDTISNIQQ